METRQTKIIVLNHFKIRESSQILNCFSRDFGKIDLNLSSKGIKDSVKLMDIFSEHYVNIVLKQEISFLKESDLIASNYGITKSINKTILGNIVLEIISKIFPKLVPDEKIYDLTSSYLSCLTRGSNENLLTIAYALKLLGITGYRTTFNFSEQELVKNRNYYYNIDEGSIYIKPISEIPTVVLDYNQCILIRNLLFAKFKEIPDINYEDGYFLLKALLKTVINIFELSKLNSVLYLK
ncbi:DNA repair protein RecO [Lagierella sp. ICN-221743]